VARDIDITKATDKTPIPEKRQNVIFTYVN